MTNSFWSCQFGKRIIYQRYICATMICISLMLLYGCRYAMSVTLAHLLPPKNFNATKLDTCIRSDAPSVKGKYLDWNAGERYYVYSSFYIGYILLHIPSGIFCDMYGAKHFLSGGVLATGLITSIFPSVLIGAPWYCSAMLQAMVGAAQGICMPALVCLMSHFIITKQSTFLIAYAYSGGCLGVMFCVAISSYFIHKLENWQGLFYFWTAFCVLWYVNSTFLIFSTSYAHPFMSKKEKQILEEEIGKALPRRIPWKKILTDTGVWALAIAQLGHSFVIFTVDMHLPQFFYRVLAVDITDNLYLVFLPYTGQWLSTVGAGLLGDYLRQMKYLPVVYIRTVYVAIGTGLPQIFIILTTYMNCNKFLIGICFFMAMLSKGTVIAGLKPNVIDITRHYAGIVQAIHNGLPAVTGLVSPYIIQYMCKKYTIQEWRHLLFLTLTICIFTTTIYFVWSKGERASWDKLVPPKDKKNKILVKPNSSIPVNNK